MDNGQTVKKGKVGGDGSTTVHRTSDGKGAQSKGDQIIVEDD